MHSWSSQEHIVYLLLFDFVPVSDLLQKFRGENVGHAFLHKLIHSTASFSDLPVLFILWSSISWFHWFSAVFLPPMILTQILIWGLFPQKCPPIFLSLQNHFFKFAFVLLCMIFLIFFYLGTLIFNMVSFQTVLLFLFFKKTSLCLQVILQ